MATDERADSRENDALLRGVNHLQEELGNIEEAITPPTSREPSSSQNTVVLERFRNDHEQCTSHAERLAGVQENSYRKSEERIQRVESKSSGVAERIRNLANKEPTCCSSGELLWVIPAHTMDITQPLDTLFSEQFRHQDGLETWTFKLKLIPFGIGAGMGSFVSLAVMLVDTGFELSSECSSKLRIALRNMDSIHEPKDGRPARPNFEVVVSPGELTKSRRSKIFETFFPHTVFQPYQGYIIEGDMLINAAAESVKGRPNHCQQWVENYEVEQFENMD